jgi:MATE family multidrug resistance protein
MSVRLDSSGAGEGAGMPRRPRGPLAEVWHIAWPTVLSMTSYPVMQFVDKLMVGQVGPLEVAAQGNGGMWAFVPLSIGMGLVTVVNTYVSQNLGAGRPREAPRYAWAALWLSAVFWIGLLAWAALLPLFFHLLGHHELENGDRLLKMELGYAVILLAGAFLTLASRSMHHFFFGLHRPKIVFVSTIAGNLANVLANYVLIFGEAGLPALGLPGVPGIPALGVYGAALGTVIGTAVELAIPLAVFLGPRLHAELQTRVAWRPSVEAVRDLARLGWPAALQFGNEIFCWAIFMSGLVATFGADHLTAGWITLTYMHLSFMPAVGFSVAVTSLVGRYIGAGQPEEALRRARGGVAIAMIYMTICAAAFVLFREWLIALFVGGEDTTPDQAARIIEIGGRLMLCAAVFQTIDAMGVVYTGALRGAGDTLWPGVVTMIYSWLLIVGGGLAMIAAFPTLESLGPWIGAAAYIIVYGLTMAIRFERGRWRSIRLLDPLRESAAQVAPVLPAVPGTEAVASAIDEASEVGLSVEERGRA